VNIKWEETHLCVVTFYKDEDCLQRSAWIDTIASLSGATTELSRQEARQWIRGQCQDQRIPHSCLENGVEDLNLANIGSCNTGVLRSAVKEAIGNDCGHSTPTEMSILHRDAEGFVEMPSFDDSMNWLVQQCFGEYGCSTDLRGHRMTSCNYNDIVAVIEDHLPANCLHSLEEELKLLTGEDDYKLFIEQMCEDAWTNIAINTEFIDIHGDFNGPFMEMHNQGLEYLNTETGNFRGTDDPAYPVTARSYAAGEAIELFDKATETPGAGNSVLRESFADFSTCEYQAFMCCWGRDRQSGDDNGTCNPGAGNCEPENSNPGDNTNLCYTKDTDFTPYPQSIEDDVHCHGFAWGNETLDSISQLKANVYFHVAMHDHLYTRGYVEPIAETASRMCGCVEDMPAVTRADCSQVNSRFNLRLTRDESTHRLAVTPNVDTDLEVLEVNFRACQGIRPWSTEDEPIRKNNDLASYLYRLKVDGKLAEKDMDYLFEETLVGAYSMTRREGEEDCGASYCAKGLDAFGTHDPTYDCSV